MKTIKLMLLLLGTTALAACQPGWVRLDGSEPGNDQLTSARTACEIDEKLAALEAFRAANNSAPAGANSNQARMLRIENYDLESARVYREIDACMQREGLRKS